MSATHDLILERRRVRRRLTFWRVLAILLVFLVGALLAPWPDGARRSGHVARIWIDGMIFADEDREARLAEIADSEAVEALIVRINSPGGTVVGAEALYEGLRRIAERKPVVAVMSEAAASGGYVAALAADHIVARGNTLTGSIGVVAEIPNVAGLLDKIGIEVTRVKSAPLKAEPSLLTEPAPGAIAAQDALIEDSFDWFKGLVAERRGLGARELAAVADGRAYTGRQALALDLVDAIGGEAQALDWLRDTHGVTTEPRDWAWDDSDLPWPFWGLEEGMAGLAGGLAGLFAREAPHLGPGPRLYALMQ